MLHRHRHRRIAIEGRLAAQHVIGGDSKRVEVRALVEFLRLDLLGTHIERRPHRRVGLSENQLLAPLADLGQPEVSHLHHSLLGEHDVLGLDVAMHDPLFGGRLQRSSCLPHDLKSRSDGDAFLLCGQLLEILTQGLAFHELLHDVMLIVDGPGGVDLHNVGMGESSCGIGFAFESFDVERVVHEFGVHELESDLSFRF